MPKNIAPGRIFYSSFLYIYVRMLTNPHALE